MRRGYRADLILTGGDPSKDLDTLRHPEGVMAAGKWYSRPELKAMADQVASSYSAAAAMGSSRYP